MREVDRLVKDVRENVGAPSNLCKQRRSRERYIGYVALMIELLDIGTSSLEEKVEKHVWIDSMVE